MDTTPNEDRNETLEALRRERTRQDEALRLAEARLKSLGNTPLAVPRAALEAIDAACLIHLSPLDRSAIRA
jgi:hypothetical protein